MPPALLKTDNLTTVFTTSMGQYAAVDGVSLEVRKDEILGLVGESGCGKSMTALSILRLVPEPAGKIVAGEVFLDQTNLLKLSEKEMCQIRGNEISMVFQEPMTSLDPVFTIGSQISETILQHRKVTRKEARLRAVEMLQRVGIPSASKRFDDYPHQLSGGMRQRVMIAMALSCHPKLLIADEPTTALDVTIQAQILELMKELQDELGMAIVLITHDLGVVADFVHNVIVMYAGRVVEKSPVTELFENPCHPYTIGLLTSIPSLNEGRGELRTIKGTVPYPFDMPAGCRFHPRCPYAQEICRQQAPGFLPVSDSHQVSCWEWQNLKGKR
jgi:oligopeptide/dipeptide ABC transporter ATP-binding protein